MKLLWWAAAGTLARQPSAPFPSFADHGSDWSGQCQTGLQSPVDIDGPILGAPAVAQPVSYWYPPVPEVELKNDGRAISAFASAPGLGAHHPEVGWHALESVRLRASAEHTIAGHRASLEVQVVNRAASGSLLILSVLFDADGPLDTSDLLTNYTAPDPASGSAVLDTFVRERPPRMKEGRLDNASATDFGALFTGATFIEYAGADTLPPCKPAMWLVREEVQKASVDQLSRLHQALYDTSEEHGNWRWVQPGNGRPLTVRKGVAEQKGENPPPSPSEDGWGTVGAYQKPGAVEFKGDQLARDVVTIEKYVTDYAKDLDVRMQRSATARLEPPVPPAPEPGTPTVPPPLVSSPGLENLRALDRAQQAFKHEVEASLHDGEIAGKLEDAAQTLARGQVRKTLMHAAAQTQPSEGTEMYHALRGMR